MYRFVHMLWFLIWFKLDNLNWQNPMSNQYPNANFQQQPPYTPQGQQQYVPQGVQQQAYVDVTNCPAGGKHEMEQSPTTLSWILCLFGLWCAPCCLKAGKCRKCGFSSQFWNKLIPLTLLTKRSRSKKKLKFFKINS